MVAGQLALLLIGSIALLALLLGFWQLRISGKLGRELSELRQQLSAIEVTRKQNTSFSNSLDQVEREQKTAEVPRSSSERYRYVASLAAQGVDSRGIAAALQMAPAEVEQLLQLARLKQQTQG
jgi:DNA-binding NarL/FixJ family response regulator